MPFRIERVGPEAADHASAILSEAWAGPSLHYSPAYLRWHLTFPGRLPPLVFVAWDGPIPIGCAASTPRRTRLWGRDLEVHLVSFVGVRPAWRGRGVAKALYRDLLTALGQAATPIVTFAEPASAGERLLQEAYDAAGFQLRRLAPHPVYGLRPTPLPPEDDLRAGSDDTCPPPSPDFCPADMLMSLPSPEEDLHYRSRPWPNAWVVARWQGTICGAARACVLEQVKAQGLIERSVALETALIPDASVATLRALASAAHRLFPQGASVTVSSFGAMNPEALVRAGIRRIPVSFQAYLAHRGPSSPPWSKVERTTLPIV